MGFGLLTLAMCSEISIPHFMASLVSVIPTLAIEGLFTRKKDLLPLLHFPSSSSYLLAQLPGSHNSRVGKKCGHQYLQLCFLNPFSPFFPPSFSTPATDKTLFPTSSQLNTQAFLNPFWILYFVLFTLSTTTLPPILPLRFPSTLQPIAFLSTLYYPVSFFPFTSLFPRSILSRISNSHLFPAANWIAPTCHSWQWYSNIGMPPQSPSPWPVN